MGKNGDSSEPKTALPAIDPSKNVCHNPHLVLLGAGASRASFPSGDATGRQLPVMRDFVEVLGLADLLDSHRIKWENQDFEAVFADLVTDPERIDLVTELEHEIYAYFDALQLPSNVTLYDEILLSLRDKDIVATFNWDPLLVQAYRRNTDIGRLPHLVFLHGNVGIAICPEHRQKGYKGDTCVQCGTRLQAVRLLYPIREKDYSQDPFIKAEWAEFSAFLEHTYLLNILGYSAPAADVEAVELMRSVWNANRTKELAQISIVDIRPEEELTSTWEHFFVRDHYGISATLDGSRLFSHPRRSCDAFAMATLQQRPCRSNPLPHLHDLDALKKWIEPLVLEEKALEETGRPFDC